MGIRFLKGMKGVFIDTSGDRCICDRHNDAGRTGGGYLGKDSGQISLQATLLTNGKLFSIVNK